MARHVEELEGPPNLGASFARAVATPVLDAVPFLGGGDEAVPAEELLLPDVAIDRDHLAAYDRVCGFRLSDRLPPTYLHVLAFPLALSLMTRRDFPLPIIGLVHIENRIVQQRSVAASERVSLRVHAERLRPHEKGRQIDLVSAASVDGETVWESRSTYLRRGAGASEEEPPRDSAARPTATPQPAGTIRVPGDIGRRYAAVAGDSNPIHLHWLSARLFGFPSAIAHGMWLKARALASLEGRLPDRLDAEVAFKKPLLLPATVELRTGHDERGWTLGVHSTKDGSPHLTGTVAAAGSPA